MTAREFTRHSKLMDVAIDSARIKRPLSIAIEVAECRCGDMSLAELRQFCLQYNVEEINMEQSPPEEDAHWRESETRMNAHSI